MGRNDFAVFQRAQKPWWWITRHGIKENPKRLIRKASIMSCGGLTGVHGHPSRGEQMKGKLVPLTSLWHWRSLSLNMQRGSSFISSRPSTKWEQMIWITSLSPVILRTGQASSFDIWQQEWGFLCFFQDIKTWFHLSRAVVIATHWLAECVCVCVCWLTSHDWVNEATWQRRLMIRFIIFGGGHFLAPEMARQLSFFLFCFFTLSGC